MLLEKIMQKRGFNDSFLYPKYGDFEKLPSVDLAAERILQAAKNHEKVLIYGDYDADGVTASTVMKDALTWLKIESEVMLPNRFTDGYGMGQRLVDYAKEYQINLVITVDCGSNNYDIIEALKAGGTEVVVTDHHEILGKLPDTIVVNPHRKDAPAPASLRNLAGVGVAFMVAYELMKKGAIPEGQEKWLLDVVLIGTLCDSMLMAGANRALCYYGMKVLEKTRRVGLKELLKQSGVKTLNAEAIGFQLGPRINAAGRMQSADLAFNLLNTQSKLEAIKLAEELEALNAARKAEQSRAVKEIAEQGTGKDPVIVANGEWHEGVLGIIAGRLVEEYHRPAFALSEVNGALKGSGRSFGDFNLAEAISECQPLLLGGGGHAGACGLSLSPEKLADFKEQVNQYYRSLKLKNQEKYLDTQADLELSDFSALTPDELAKLSQLEPYGEGNAEPVLLLKDVAVREVRQLGEDNQHLSLIITDKTGKTFKTLAFFAPADWLQVAPGEHLHLWIHLLLNEWQGTKSAEGRIIKLERITE